MESKYIKAILMCLSYIIFTIILSFSLYHLFKEKSEKQIQNIPKIEQSVTILEDNRQSILDYNWIVENEEDLKLGKLNLNESPFSDDKTVYKLKTSMDSLNSFVYGSDLEIEKQKCVEYNNFNRIRNNLLKLNKPNKCK